MPKAKTRVLLYTRCSTTEQAEEGMSIDAQMAKLDAYARLYDLEVVGEHSDPGVSAKSFGGLQRTLERRTGLAQVLARLDAGEADGIAVMKLDRLSRSVRDLDELVSGWFSDRFALFSVSEQLDTRSAGGRMVLNILASVAQGERETIGERTAAALSLKRSRQEYCGGHAPYGWVRQQDGTLSINLGERHAIARATTWRSLGLSLRQIGAALEAEGIYPRSGKRWHAETVGALIRSPVIRAT